MATILLDKSALEALSFAELKASRRRDQILATDVLLLEILGDLRYGCDETAKLASKLLVADTYVNVPYHLLCGRDLLGEEVSMQGVPVLEGHDVEDPAGERGTIAEPSEGEMALVRWAEGEFEDDDLEYARQWNEGVRNLDLGFFERGVRLAVPRNQQPSTIDSIAALMDDALSSRDAQEGILESILAALFLPDEWNESIRRRWGEGHLLLARDAAFTARCARTMFTFLGAVGSRLVGTKRSNLVDAQYLMYLPFCDVFASGDKAQLALFPFVSLRGQVVLSCEQLKARFTR